MFRTTFYGQTISDYGRTYGRVDYRALANSFDAVLCNSILGYRESWDEWEQIHGFVDNSEEIAEKKEQLEELEELLEETKEAKAEAESNYDDCDEAYTNISDLLERFDDFEYEANELLDQIKWHNYELPSGEDLDSDTIEREVEALDFWSMREAIESHQSQAENERDEAEKTFNEASEEVERLEKTIKDLEAEIEELEAEDSTETEYYQYYIIDYSGYQILSENTNEAIWYNEELDLYVWGVTHWGTSWDYVLTSIPCETYEQTEAREAKENPKSYIPLFDAYLTETEAESKTVDLVEELSRIQKNNGIESISEAVKMLCGEAEADKPFDVATAEELLNLWDGDEAEAVEDFEVFTDEDGNEVVEPIEEVEEVEEWHPIDWEVATIGDIVIGKGSASIVYGITTEGWKGKITEIRPSKVEDGDTEDPHRFIFTAKGFDNEPNEFGIDPNKSWDCLNSMYFEVYTDKEA